MEIQYGQYNVPKAGNDIIPKENECVKFSVGQPSTEMLPLDIIKKGMNNFISNINNKSVLQYGDIKGYKKFREDLAKYLESRYNTKVDCEDLFITNGNTDALTFILSLLLKTNSKVYVEDPSYFLAIDVAKKDLKMNVTSISMQNDGINLDELENNLRNDNPDEIKVLYTVPTCHNPTSITMSHEKRVKLAQLTKKYKNFIIVADEVYQLLTFIGEKHPPLPLCYYTDNAISLGSFSKILAPALRMGWMQIKNKDLMKVFVNSGQMDSSGGKNPVSQAIIHEIIKNGDLDKCIDNCKNFLTNNCKVLTSLVDYYLLDYVEYEKPIGGYFLWLKLKNDFKGKDIIEYATKRGVTFTLGERFTAHNNYTDRIRISFSYYNPDGLEIGIKRLRRIFDDITKLKISILGYKGKLGSRISHLATYNNKLKLLSGIDRDMKIDYSSDVIIDVSSTEGTEKLLCNLIDNNKKIPVIIGTTGDLPYELIDKYSKIAPIALISNFSKGIPKVLNFLKNNNYDDFSISMKETHYIHKKDAPSGTAKRLADIANIKYEDVKSIREGDVIGTHEIVIENEYEKIVIAHEAKNRDVFAHGAIWYALNIINKKVGLYKELFEENKINFSKYSGCGNEFVMINNSIYNFSDKEKINITKIMSHNIKTDGVIFLRTDNKKVIEWTYLNSDGSIVEMCGNGARCVVQWCLDNNIKPDYIINNYDFITIIKYTKNSFKIKMPKIKNYDKNVKSIGNTDVYFKGHKTVGVPHAVFELKEYLTLDDYSPFEIGENYNVTKPYFNVNIYQHLDKNKYLVRTYEKGVWNETLACGTGCCAVASIIKENTGLSEIELIVRSDEIIKVTFDKNNNCWLEGNAVKVFDGCY